MLTENRTYANVRTTLVVQSNLE